MEPGDMQRQCTVRYLHLEGQPFCVKPATAYHQGRPVCGEHYILIRRYGR